MRLVARKDDDIVIVHRVEEHGGTAACKHVYVVACHGDDEDVEFTTLDAAEEEARAWAEDRRISVWYVGDLLTRNETLLASYRGPQGSRTKFSGEICASCGELIVDGQVEYRPTGVGTVLNPGDALTDHGDGPLVFSVATVCRACIADFDKSS